MFGEIWPLISVVLGIIILLTLIIGLKLNTFISLIITSMITALLLGMPPVSYTHLRAHET